MSQIKEPIKKLDFEKALERLEQIVQVMEDGELPLEAMMEQFEEGMGLLKFCSRKLDEVEQKIELLLKEKDETKLVPFEENSPEDDLLINLDKNE